MAQHHDPVFFGDGHRGGLPQAICCRLDWAGQHCDDSAYVFARFSLLCSQIKILRALHALILCCGTLESLAG